MRSIALLCALAAMVPAASASGGLLVRAAAPGAPAPVARPIRPPIVVDGDYVQSQLARLATHNLHREAGQDAGLPPWQNGHDEFAADWLAALRAALAGLPLRVTRQQFPLPGFRSRPPRTPGTNLIVALPGMTRPDEWVLLVTHYDGTPTTTESAYDDASGCAILLGVARALAPMWRRHRPARTIAFILFDGEEQGMIGSFYFARSYQNGAPHRIVAVYNEEQNGVGYPIRPFGAASNPLLPEHALVTPRLHGSRWVRPVAPSFWPALESFSAALVAARARAFAALHHVYPRLAYGNSAAPIFTPADERMVLIGDDVLGGSDQVPFERLGLPAVVLVGNVDHYLGYPRQPWSYPNDTSRDTMALLERIASGQPRPSPALAASLALPGQITVEMLRTAGWGAGS